MYGRVTSIVDPIGTTTYSHDVRGNVRWVKDPEGRYSFSTYDSRGLLTEKGAGLSGTTVTMAYDSYDRLTTVTDSIGVNAVYQYDAIDRMTTATDAAGRKVFYEYSQTTGTLTAIWNPAGGKISFEYDRYGNVTKVTDERGKQTSYKYDFAGRMTTETTPLGASRFVEYDDTGSGCSSCGGHAGVVTATTDFAGNRDTYEYDDAMRLKRIKFTGSSDWVALARDSYGRVTSCTDTRIPSADWGSSTFQYTYNKLDQATTTTYPDGATVQYLFDATTGRRTKMIGPDGNGTDYSYANTSTNKKLDLIDHPLTAVEFGYDSQGRLSGMLRMVSNSETLYSYDGNGRLSDVSEYSDRVGRFVREESYSFDGLSRRSRIDLISEAGEFTDHRREYTYDSLSRLTREDRYTASSGTTRGWGRRFSFDNAGNRIELQNYNGSTTATTGYSPNDWNRYSFVDDFVGPWTSGDVAVDGDSNGNVLAVYDVGYNGYISTHDRSGRLTAWQRYKPYPTLLATVTYAYDTAGKLILRTGANSTKEKYYYADGLSRIMTKEKPSGGSWRTKTMYMLKPGMIGQVVGERAYGYPSSGSTTPNSTTDRFYHYDSLGNVTMRTGTSGEVLDLYDMDAYGNVVS